MTNSHPWISDRPPTRNDADLNSYVEVRKTPNGKQGIQLHWKQVVAGQQWRFTRHWREPIQNGLETHPSAHGTCKTCCYWKDLVKPGGECRRNAPQSVTLQAAVDYTPQIAYWPATHEEDWCGEWEAKS